MLAGDAAGAFDGAQAGGDPGLAGGDCLTVALAVGAFGQTAAEASDFDAAAVLACGRVGGIRSWHAWAASIAAAAGEKVSRSSPPA